jgi:hypothetical protein
MAAVDEPQDLVTEAEAAQLVGVTRHTVERWLQWGLLLAPPSALGGWSLPWPTRAIIRQRGPVGSLCRPSWLPVMAAWTSHGCAAGPPKAKSAVS